jgi:hypothetical protein
MIMLPSKLRYGYIFLHKYNTKHIFPVGSMFVAVNTEVLSVIMFASMLTTNTERCSHVSSDS